MKNKFSLLLASFFSILFIYSCGSDGSSSDSTISGEWSIVKQEVTSNAISDIDQSFNYWLDIQKKDNQPKQQFNVSSTSEDGLIQMGKLITTELENGERVEVKNENYKLVGDSIYVLNSLTNKINMRGTYSLSSSSLVISYAVEQSELRSIAMSLGIDPNLILAETKGVLKVSCSR